MTVAFVIGNGTSRKDLELHSLKKYGKVYACNAVFRTFEPDYLVAVDVKMILEINHAKYQITVSEFKRYYDFQTVYFKTTRNEAVYRVFSNHYVNNIRQPYET